MTAALPQVGTNWTHRRTGQRWAVSDAFERQGVGHVVLIAWAGGRRQTVALDDFERDYQGRGGAPPPQPDVDQAVPDDL